MSEFSSKIASNLGIAASQVEVVLELLAGGATIPFVARYRKDKTGALDEVQIQSIQDQEKSLKEFSDRKNFIEKTITEQGKMTEALQAKIDAAVAVNELEDIYLPYKPKRKTKAQTARENGLEPLADKIANFTDEDINALANSFINEKVADVDAAIQGARDILAERINEDADTRATMRQLFEKEGQFVSHVMTGKEEDGAKYKDYFEFSELISKIPSHRTLAILRGFTEGILRMEIAPTEERALEVLESKYLQKSNNADLISIYKRAIRDAYRRLLQPSLESEFRSQLKTDADEEAINVFSENLRQLLLSSPLGNKRVLAIDPGFRTGCKTVVLDAKGELLETALIFVHEKNQKLVVSEATIRSLVGKYKTEAFAIGDGTAGRETEQFIKSLQLNIPIFMVNEDGASVYSASATAREEFPDQDVTVRGSVSIGRRLMDPLAELVKIDPKSIGVGQYQHDVNQIRLKEKLDQTVISCVNAVGVNLNTASKHLLSYVSGIGPSIAENIVHYRNEIGTFNDRKQLKKVARLGDKAFEQCAGFLRIREGANPLDSSAVHPEAYKVVAEMAKDLNVEVAELIGNTENIKKINKQKYVSEEFGLLTIDDILKELNKPGLDPRSELEQFEFANVFAIEDLQVGMVVPGMVTNLTRFGAFVDIGVHQDGLVHISEISDHFISDPSEALKLNDKVQVRVLEVDMSRKRISLSIKQAMESSMPKRKSHTSSKGKRQPEVANNGTMADALAALKMKFTK